MLAVAVFGFLKAQTEEKRVAFCSKCFHKSLIPCGEAASSIALKKRVRNVSLKACVHIQRVGQTYAFAIRSVIQNCFIAPAESLAVGEEQYIFFGQNRSLIDNVDKGLTAKV